MTVIGHPIHSAARPTTVRELRKPSTRRITIDPLEDRLWAYYDQVEGIGNYVSVLANAADLVTYFPAVDTGEPDAEPEPSTERRILSVWDELGGEGWLSQWMSELVRHMSVTGQAWLVPTTRDRAMLAPPDQDVSAAQWEVWSTFEVRRGLGLNPDERIPDDERIWRIWMPHPQDFRRADSPVRRVADKCEVLVLLDRRRIADSRTRLFAGVWPLPSRLRNEKTPSGKLWADLVEESLIEPIHDPASTASVIPLMMYVEPDEMEMMQSGPVSLAIDDPARIDAMEEKVLRRIAIGIDAPQELILGMGSLNHWQAWLIEKSTYSQHLDPMIVRILRSLSDWWKAQLDARGIPFDQQILWRNEASALATPNRFENSVTLHDKFVISDDVLRRAGDFTDDDAPTDEEVERRIRIAQASRARIESQMPLEVELEDAGTPESENPAEEDAQPEPPIQSQTRVDLDRLGRRLVDIDQTLLIRVEREAARQMRRVRRSITDRLARAARAEGLDVGDPDTLAERLGPTEVQRLLGDDLVSGGDFDTEPFLALILAAQADTATATEPYAERNRQADRDDAGIAAGLLAAALAAATLRYLYRRPPTDGERGVDGAELVPVSDMRRALDVAGGGEARRDGTQDAWMLVANGRRTVIDLQAAGLTTQTFRWVYGTAPREPFPPHRALDGVSFNRWDDPVLEQRSETWVPGSHWFPGDHGGCRCTVERVLAESDIAA